ncbi:unnamed protein product [Chrysoparadoxa australica]
MEAAEQGQGGGVHQSTRVGGGEEGADGKTAAAAAQPPGPSAAEADEAPKGHWRCLVCRRLNAYPKGWTGRPSKGFRAVIQRRATNKAALYTRLKEVEVAPECRKCFTPCTYRLRASAEYRTRKDEGEPQSELASKGAIEEGDEGGIQRRTPFWEAGVKRARRWLGLDLQDQQGVLAYDYAFRQQMNTYFKPDMPRRTLPPGERYSIGDRIETYANKGSWSAGTVLVVRQNNTYDIRFDNGEEARYVFPHMLRSVLEKAKSPLVRLWYGEVLLAMVIWPYVGLVCVQSTGSGNECGAVQAAPILMIALVTICGVAAQFTLIFIKTRLAGFWYVYAWALLYMVPFVFLLILGGSVASHLDEDPANSSSWMMAVCLPAALFSAVAYPYVLGVKPFYATVWRYMSAPWILFLLLLSVKLDARDGYRTLGGRWSWFIVYAPLQLCALGVAVLVYLLPRIWEVEPDPEVRVPLPRLWREAKVLDDGAGEFEPHADGE